MTADASRENSAPSLSGRGDPMSVPLRIAILDFIVDLRSLEVRISVADSIDALNAVAAAGIERARMREALRATLVKDEADGESFDAVFARRFGTAHPTGAPRRSDGAQIGVSGRGRGSGSGASLTRPLEAEPAAVSSAARDATPAQVREARPEPAQREGTRGEEGSSEGEAESSEGEAESGTAASESGAAVTGGGENVASQRDGVGVDDYGASSGREARLREIELVPFAAYSDLEYENARATLGLLKRRLRVKLSRRLRIARTGRIDFRRTIRAGIQRGGRFAELRFRARRPRHVDLLLLTDISGSVRYASTLMLDLAAGVRECFRRVRSFVYVDRMAEASFEQGHLVMEPLIDLYARSDFGRVLIEIWEQRAVLLNRATLVVIIGDARNNRRAARTDLLREIASRCRAVWWLNPEPPEHWNTGDSVIAQYARETDGLVACGNLRELERALARVS
jgi:uncharacterized protein with von Willebrand factor type A (vWA) domain